MRTLPLAPTPLARTRGLPPNPDAFRGGPPGALRRELPPATSGSDRQFARSLDTNPLQQPPQDAF
eukprot:5619431-Prymnesium_polylepis.1